MRKHRVGIGGIIWWHRIDLPGTGYTDGEVNHGPDGGDWPTTRFGLPEDLKGKLVLDIGAWDGFFSFEAEKRGAAYVAATDCTEAEGGNPSGSDGFRYAKKALDSKVLWKYFNIEGEAALGTFDLVMCFGVLYHLKNPLKAMENLSALCHDTCLIETAISTQPVPAILEYRPGHANDPTNYFYPNTKWIETAALQVGFKSCEIVWIDDQRATYRLRK